MIALNISFIVVFLAVSMYPNTDFCSDSGFLDSIYSNTDFFKSAVVFKLSAPFPIIAKWGCLHPLSYNC
jgi:hypothetical protein